MNKLDQALQALSDLIDTDCPSTTMREAYDRVVAAMNERNYTVTVDPDGALLLHTPDCPMVHDHRRKELPLMTMLGCEGELPDEVKRHRCLANPKT
jgi:hypothetical protein